MPRKKTPARARAEELMKKARKTKTATNKQGEDVAKKIKDKMTPKKATRNTANKELVKQGTKDKLNPYQKKFKVKLQQKLLDHGDSVSRSASDMANKKVNTSSPVESTYSKRERIAQHQKKVAAKKRFSKMADNATRGSKLGGASRPTSQVSAAQKTPSTKKTFKRGPMMRIIETGKKITEARKKASPAGRMKPYGSVAQKTPTGGSVSPSKTTSPKTNTKAKPVAKKAVQKAVNASMSETAQKVRSNVGAKEVRQDNARKTIKTGERKLRKSAAVKKKKVMNRLMETGKKVEQARSAESARAANRSQKPKSSTSSKPKTGTSLKSTRGPGVTQGGAYSNVSDKPKARTRPSRGMTVSGSSGNTINGTAKETMGSKVSRAAKKVGKVLPRVARAAVSGPAMAVAAPLMAVSALGSRKASTKGQMGRGKTSPANKARAEAVKPKPTTPVQQSSNTSTTSEVKTSSSPTPSGKGKVKGRLGSKYRADEYKARKWKMDHTIAPEHGGTYVKNKKGK